MCGCFFGFDRTRLLIGGGIFMETSVPSRTYERNMIYPLPLFFIYLQFRAKAESARSCFRNILCSARGTKSPASKLYWFISQSSLWRVDILNPGPSFWLEYNRLLASRNLILLVHIRRITSIHWNIIRKTQCYSVLRVFLLRWTWAL